MEVGGLNGKGAWLLNSMEPAISRVSLYYKTVNAIWEMVEEMYSDLGNSAQIFEIKSALREKRQGNLSVTEYYNELQVLWQELDLY